MTELLRDDIAALRLNTQLTGSVVDAQVRSASMWPTIAFPEVQAHTTSIDTEKCVVSYLLTLKKGRHIKKLNHLRIIEESVWALFGDHWRVSFAITGRRGVLYAGGPRKEKKRVGETGADPQPADPEGARRVPRVQRKR